ncbi:putative necrosis-inducing factor-domain-containing protein [Durotheca rogersii]|uniref:putative necrosis-inducing factor-domain-containing protein n=1 Tax=Durotheca rogersii TaxID=419775 RepID=UPI00221F69AF|nr:putative necrosis-inducing factor-domain-containing protein [Durotheca rogersii]KAI5861566.1 putative necrosis-inducing factor-domain-containing protein [Durotheca rogersii]
MSLRAVLAAGLLAFLGAFPPLPAAPGAASAAALVAPAPTRPVLEPQAQHPSGRVSSVYPRGPYEAARARRSRARAYRNDTRAHELCAESTFADTTNASALAAAADCAAIAADLRAHPGYFALGSAAVGGTWARLAASGTCAFGVRRPTPAALELGDKDVRDSITVALARFHHGGRVAAAGNFSCAGVPVTWVIGRAV